jgi:hypothetical protein
MSAKTIKGESKRRESAQQQQQQLKEENALLKWHYHNKNYGL